MYDARTRKIRAGSGLLHDVRQMEINIAANSPICGAQARPNSEWKQNEATKPAQCPSEGPCHHERLSQLSFVDGD